MKIVFVTAVLLSHLFTGGFLNNTLADFDSETFEAIHDSRPVYFDGAYAFKLTLLRNPDRQLAGADLSIWKLGRYNNEVREWKRHLRAEHRFYVPSSPREWRSSVLYVESAPQTPEKLSFLIFDAGRRYMAFRDGTIDPKGNLNGVLREGHNPRNPNDMGVYRSTKLTFFPVD